MLWWVNQHSLNTRRLHIKFEVLGYAASTSVFNNMQTPTSLFVKQHQQHQERQHASEQDAATAATRHNHAFCIIPAL
jgi:hypothetical protein